MIPYISYKGRKACFAVLKKYSSLGKLPPLSACQLFDTHVSSVLNYAAEIWGQDHEVSKLESVHYKYLKLTLGVKDTTSNIAVLGEFARFPMYITHINIEENMFAISPKYADDITWASNNPKVIEMVKETVPPMLKKADLKVNESKTEEYAVPTHERNDILSEHS